MRTILRKACAVIGGIVFLAGGAFVTERPIALLVWLAVSISLLFAGKAVSFQQK